MKNIDWECLIGEFSVLFLKEEFSISFLAGELINLFKERNKKLVSSLDIKAGGAAMCYTRDVASSPSACHFHIS